MSSGVLTCSGVSFSKWWPGHLLGMFYFAWWPDL